MTAKEPPRPEGAGVSSGVPAVPAFDRTWLEQQVGPDEDTLRYIVNLFLADSPAWLEELCASLRSGDAAGVRAGAHRLAGTCSTLGAPRLAGASRHLEMLGKAGDLAGAEQALQAVLAAYQELRPVLDEVVRKGQA